MIDLDRIVEIVIAGIAIALVLRVVLKEKTV